MTDIICISPIDGREVARRSPASGAEIDAAIRSARGAQLQWSRTPIEERGDILLAALEVLGDMNDDVVHESFIEQTNNYTLGDPTDRNVSLGPMAAIRFADHVRGQVAEARAGGATIHIDANRFERDVAASSYLAPQVLTNVTHAMRVMHEESFGPVVGIMKVRNDTEVVDLMNDSAYGLTASIWTKDLDAAAQIGARIRTGTVFANRCDYLDPGLAWTGVKQTGRGASLSKIGYETLTRPMSFHLKQI